MDEIAKAEARNYVSMSGFLLLGLFALLHIISSLNSLSIPANLLNLVMGGVVLILSIFLAVIGNRGLTTIFFFTEGMLIFVGALVTDVATVFPLLAGVNIVLAILMLFSPDGKKFVYFLLSLFTAVVALCSIFGWPSVISLIALILTVVLYVWCGFCCAAERTGFPGRALICEDESIDFKTSGSVLGYLLFALVGAAWAVYYFFSENVLPLVGVHAIEMLAGFLLIFLAILLFSIAKMRFTPMIFTIVGTIFILSTIVGGFLTFAYGAVFVVLGIFALFRNESRVLLALFLIIYGLTFFISVAITGNYSLGIFHAILNLIPCLVALYIGFAVFSQDKKLLI